ncbi:MAG TPA: hypothetical protein VIJ14_01740 [Rhabdochlamydiaceae bacterium]
MMNRGKVHAQDIQQTLLNMLMAGEIGSIKVRGFVLHPTDYALLAQDLGINLSPPGGELTKIFLETSYGKIEVRRWVE